MRESGILMHITSLPGPYGIGTMGKNAYKFVDFLKESGQRVWQILPLSPTGYGDSPYQSCSTFAGNHYLIDLDTLVEEGLLEKEDLAGITWCDKETKVNFGTIYNHRLSMLRKAYSRFQGSEAFDDFCHENSSWLADFALFMALKDRFGGAPWYQWEEKLKLRDADAIWQARRENADAVRFYSFVQYLFFKQWNGLHTYANENGVRIIGDVPFYVPYDSVDVWADPELFQLDSSLTPEAVAGCPPDGFTEDGQLWGNPLYRWDAMEKNDYSWWIRRLAAAGRMYDMVRLDHFRAIEAYWAVPYGEKTARNGKWIKGPDMGLIQAIKKEIPQVKMIAEDLGFLTQEVLDLRDNSGFPGMKVLEFAFYDGCDSEYLPHKYPRNAVCYLGTHDNVTMKHWFEENGADTVAYAKDYMNLTEAEGLVWGSIRTAFSSVADLCVIQMQDYMELGAEGRMNFPGTQTDANWTWRAESGFTDGLAARIYKLTKLYDRLGD